MNKEDIINPLELDALCEHLLQENKQLKLAIETLKETNKLLLQQKGQLQEDLDMLDKENDKLKDNWNKLKEFTQEKYDNPSWASCGARYILEKMQELEKGDSNG